MTHQATANRWSLFSCMVSVVAPIWFSGRCFCDGRTDTLRDNNDHLFGHGLMGQKSFRSPQPNQHKIDQVRLLFHSILDPSHLSDVEGCISCLKEKRNENV